MELSMETGDITGLGKPVDSLVNRIFNIIERKSKPQYEKDLDEVKAKSKIKIIEAETDYKVQEIKTKANKLNSNMEIYKLENITDIFVETVPKLLESPDIENLKEDWIYNFVDKAQMSSDKNIQKIWAKILAGEINNQNSFSKRTIDIIANISSNEAKLFEKFCSQIVGIEYDDNKTEQNDNFYPYFSSDIEDNNNFLLLQEIGLVAGASKILNDAVISGDTFFKIKYFYKNIELNIPISNTNKMLTLTPIFLTKSGQELYSITEKKENTQFFEKFKNELKKQNIEFKEIK